MNKFDKNTGIDFSFSKKGCGKGEMTVRCNVEILGEKFEKVEILKNLRDRHPLPGKISDVFSEWLHGLIAKNVVLTDVYDYDDLQQIIAHKMDQKFFNDHDFLKYLGY